LTLTSEYQLDDLIVKLLASFLGCIQQGYQVTGVQGRLFKKEKWIGNAQSKKNGLSTLRPREVLQID